MITESELNRHDRLVLFGAAIAKAQMKKKVIPEDAKIVLGRLYTNENIPDEDIVAALNSVVVVISPDYTVKDLIKELVDD